MITDSHCHLASHRYADQDVGQLIARAKSAGVHRMVTLATSLADVSQNLEIAEHVGVSAAIGIHPCDVHHAPDNAVETHHRGLLVKSATGCCVCTAYRKTPPYGLDE